MSSRAGRREASRPPKTRNQKGLYGPQVKVPRSQRPKIRYKLGAKRPNSNILLSRHRPLVAPTWDPCSLYWRRTTLSTGFPGGLAATPRDLPTTDCPTRSSEHTHTHTHFQSHYDVPRQSGHAGVGLKPTKLRDIRQGRTDNVTGPDPRGPRGNPTPLTCKAMLTAR